MYKRQLKGEETYWLQDGKACVSVYDPEDLLFTEDEEQNRCLVTVDRKELLSFQNAVSAWGMEAPVSYTHLDVYKRQLHHASRDSQTQLKKSRRSGNRQASGRQAPFKISAAARYVLIKIQTTFHYIVADPESRNA